MRHQHREVRQPEPLGVHDGHRIGRRGGLEPDPEEHHLLVRVVGGHPGGVERRVHDANVASAGTNPEQVATAAGNPQHVAERAEDDVVARRDLEGAVDHLQRGDADRAARAVDEFHGSAQQLVDAVADDRMGLPATHFHDRPGPGGSARDGLDEGLGRRRIAELVEVFHAEFLFMSPGVS